MGLDTMPSMMGAASMPEFDENVLSNMMVAIELGRKHLTGNFDTIQNRTRINDAIVEAATLGTRTLAQFVDVALNEVAAIRGFKPRLFKR